MSPISRRGDRLDPMRYCVCIGAVQPYVFRSGDANTPMFMEHFGLPEYDMYKPVLKRYMEDRVQPILDGLNNGTLTEDEARKKLKRI